MVENKLTIAADVACDLVMQDDLGNYVREYDEVEHIDLVTEHADRFGVKAVMVDPEGPGGGHPVYEFTGTKDQLTAFVIDFFEAGRAHSEDVEFYFESAVIADES